MSPGELIRALRRRWYVLIVAAVLAAAGAVQVLHPTQTYLSTAIVVLKPPVTDNQPNQLANLQPPLAAVSYAAIQQLDSPEGTEELRAAGVRGTYRLIPRNSGTSVTPRYLIPSLQIQAEQAEPASADTAVRKIIEIYTKHLTDMQTQQGVPDSARMSVTLLVPPTAAVQTGNKSRGLAGAALMGGVGGVVVALWTDRLLTRRSRRRQRHEAAADAGPVVRAEEPERAALAGATR
ncbi:Wzz/FepE/Etk N-terminal domain-containing protein [Streptomyces sp. NBC_00273]|uniref:Wzz/FepE/Etk N-terminal domain-containing protein n=1 Tax=Streptomyces sp. NBC_00273 TaxID=2903644 RepID=UPI002E2CE332|nr:Wzz/FepE/Etk N-terminal domain-containing protein [Streptomyces sp. NBC_00273]